MFCASYINSRLQLAETHCKMPVYTLTAVKKSQKMTQELQIFKS